MSVEEKYVTENQCESRCDLNQFKYEILEDKIDKLEKSVDKINTLATATEKLAANMEMMLKEQERQRTQLDTLQNSGGKKWNEVKKMVLSAIISVVVATLAVVIGMKG